MDSRAMRQGPLRPAVFLDRDGVVNETEMRDGKPRAPASLAEFRFIPGAVEAAARLSGAGFAIVVVTNQPDVARGWQTRDRVEAINRHVAERLGVAGVYVCYHLDADGCACRKPLPGMLRSAAVDHGLDLSGSYLVGDRWTDVLAGASAGVTPIWVRAEENARFDAVGAGDRALFARTRRCADLAAAADWILARERGRGG